MKRIILYLFLLVMIVFCHCSCGIVNKNKGSKSSSSDSTGVSVKKETQVTSNDSGGKKTFENETKNEQSKEETGGLNLEFDNSDTTKATGPIKISTDSAGNTVIDPGGRALKSVTDTRSKKTTTTKTEKQSGTDSTHVISKTETAKTDSSAANVKKKAAEETSHTFRFNPDLLWFLLIPAGWLLWIYRKKIPFIKNLFP
ncbi:MAG: hypothetical protein V4450_07500 [Bacteroidota bacterium]